MSIDSAYFAAPDLPEDDTRETVCECGFEGEVDGYWESLAVFVWECPECGGTERLELEATDLEN